jgi:hypothetical protein
VANALAVGGEGGLIVISPPWRAAPGVFDDLTSFGPVRALIASNAFHHLGLAQWQARFPGATMFAPAQSVARVSRLSKLEGIRPLAAAQTLAGPRVELVDMPHYRTGELLVRIKTGRGLAWYVTDVITNMSALPGSPLFKFLFWMSGSAPGLRFNNVAPLFMMRDKTALRRWMREEFRKNPPQWLIPTHGDIVDFAQSPEKRTLFD